MKVYRVTIEGRTFEVQVEPAEDPKGNPETPQEGRAFSGPDPCRCQKEQEPRQGQPASEEPQNPEGSKTICAPMPGTVQRLLVKEGEPVREGQPVLCLEAMKMENEIFSPLTGMVTSIWVEAGTSVKNGERLMTVSG